MDRQIRNTKSTLIAVCILVVCITFMPISANAYWKVGWYSKQNGHGYVYQYRKAKLVRKKFFTWSQVSGNVKNLKTGAGAYVTLRRGAVKRVHIK